MIRVAVVEDEDQAAETLSAFLARYGGEHGEEFHVTRYTDGTGLLDHYCADFDLIFMDIEMPYLDGMQTAERLRKLDETTILVFITNLARYAIRGYEVDALDYILKPVTYAAFAMKLRRAVQRIRQRSPQRVTLRTKSGEVSFPASSIRYVESRGHAITWHTETGLHESYGTMKEVEQTLSTASFFRCSSGIVVNLRCVSGYDRSEVQLGNDRLPISRSRKAAFVAALQSFYAQGGR